MIDSADQVGLVLLFRQPCRAAAEVAPLSDSANTDEPRAWDLMNASAWIETNRSASTLRAFIDTVCKLHEVVAIANEHGAHVRLVVDQRLEFFRDCQRDVLLVGAAAAFCARVLAAMARIDGDGDQARYVRRHATAFLPLRLGALAPANASCLLFGFSGGGSRRAGVSFFSSRASKGSTGSTGIDVQHQPMTIVADRLECENLRLDLCLSGPAPGE